MIDAVSLSSELRLSSQSQSPGRINLSTGLHAHPTSSQIQSEYRAEKVCTTFGTSWVSELVALHRAAHSVAFCPVLCKANTTYRCSNRKNSDE